MTCVLQTGAYEERGANWFGRNDSVKSYRSSGLIDTHSFIKKSFVVHTCASAWYAVDTNVMPPLKAAEIKTKMAMLKSGLKRNWSTAVASVQCSLNEPSKGNHIEQIGAMNVTERRICSITGCARTPLPDNSCAVKFPSAEMVPLCTKLIVKGRSRRSF